MIDIIPFVVAFIAGVCVKAVDWIDDDRGGKNPLKWPLAIIYGLLIGYLIGTASFFVLFVAALIAQVFARKIDTRAHMLGFAIAVISILYFGLQPIDIGLLVFFLVLAFLDEADFIGALRPLEDYRVFLKGGALVMILFGRWDFFLGIICFDIGYELFRLSQKRVFKQVKQK